MKKIFKVLLVLSICFALVGCGNNEEKIKESLCSTQWGYSWYAPALSKNCYDVYDFKKDGTCTNYFTRDNEDVKVKNGTYVIDGNKIFFYDNEKHPNTVVIAGNEVKVSDESNEGKPTFGFEFEFNNKEGITLLKGYGEGQLQDEFTRCKLFD